MLTEVQQNTACRKDLGMYVLTEVLSANPDSTLFVNFGVDIPVDFSGKFMIHAETTNIKSIDTFLKDVNGNIIPEAGTNQQFVGTDMVYNVSAVVKKITVYGMALASGPSTVQLFLITGAMIDTLTDIGTTFTDGSRYANVLVRELYFPPEALGNDNPDLAILQVRKIDQTSSTLITIVDMNSFNAATGSFGRYFYSTQCTDDVLVLKGWGGYAGKKCYMVVNWDTAWDFYSKSSMIIDNEVIIKAKLKRYEVSHLKFSPNIAEFLEQGGGSDDLGTINLPADITFVREQFVMDDAVSYSQFNVGNESQLASAVASGNHVIINLTNDIQLSATINIDQDKNVVINGCGHHIYQYNNAISSATVSGGRKVAVCNNLDVHALMGFNTPDGETLTLEKSPIIRANGWIGADFSHVTNVLSIPSGFSVDLDNVFAHFPVLYLRNNPKILSWSTDNRLTLDFDAAGMDVNSSPGNCYAGGQNTYTKQPYIFLSNYDSGGTPEGVIVKNGTVRYPMRYSGIALITLDNLFFVRPGGKLEINNLKLTGSTEYVISNRGELKLNHCEVSNRISGGIKSAGKLFVSDCYFHDVLKKAILSWCDNSLDPYADITNCIFKRIGWYGTNTFAVESRGKGYIANNLFEDTNYGAVGLGCPGTTDENKRLASYNLMEYNTVYYTDTWKVLRKKLALQDNGAVYNFTNNNLSVIRYNKILGFGGPDYGGKGKGRGIYADDGAYNMMIYCNIVTHTEVVSDDHYDIDSRDCSDLVEAIPAGSTANTNNIICYNLCDGCLKMQEHLSTESGTMPTDNGCRFEKNVVIRPFNRFVNYSELYKNTVNSEYHPYTAHIPIVYDTRGSIDEEGNILSPTDYLALFGCDHIGAALVSNWQ